jgi:hypothetical protein
MALREITLGGKKILVEVADLPVEGKPLAPEGERFENTSVPARVGDLADHIENLVAVLTAPVQAAFKGSKAEEWALEVNFGFKGETGLPFVAKGEANAAVKVTAKWKKPAD